MKALITGATRGPGKAIAIKFARAGFETYAMGRDRVALEDIRSEAGVQPMALDLTDRDAVRLVVEGMQPDVIVHSALRWPDITDFSKLAEAEIDMALEVNLSASWHLTRVALPSMLAKESGAIIVITPEITGNDLLKQAISAAGKSFADGFHSEYASKGISASHFFSGRAQHELVAEQALNMVHAKFGGTFLNAH
ncbi:SDR family oxidoreductase [Falsochrobactrum sp. TDYN1]|uniref:SDR family oxidoreductase n=1 Tax=Falsochrobactrum tianjinense TaxID=2706015 RepID=A0A949PMI8_9HYPH|nr:SDR family oxidoreductase [Falsochrobactrum sp. TDYN1]MBV2143433.1 SDR family oxidoreductase [Falsochrobactrum sp. TDYN1]